MKQRRKSKRPYILAKVKIKLGGSAPSMEAVAINLSRKGIGVYTGRPLKQGSKVVIKLTFFDGKGFKTTEDAPGIVRWVLEMGGQYAAGIQFNTLILKKRQPALYACLEYAKRHS
ncbi:MAG: PilZ domain-containing protein [Deltaproteobacteria bacterium]|nr:PilZ domain-containing protein [Deltaproteobacteria bacterium]